jgi:hypothetical protein
MNTQHLSDDELNRAVLGEALTPEASAHLGMCLVCRRQRDGFLALVARARATDPDEDMRERARESALTAWSGVQRRHWQPWLAVAAAVALLVLVPLVRTHGPSARALDAHAVMVGVENVLDRDPLAEVASQEIVDTVVPSNGAGEEGSES